MDPLEKTSANIIVFGLFIAFMSAVLYSAENIALFKSKVQNRQFIHVVNLKLHSMLPEVQPSSITEDKPDHAARSETNQQDENLDSEEARSQPPTKSAMEVASKKRKKEIHKSLPTKKTENQTVQKTKSKLLNNTQNLKPFETHEAKDKAVKKNVKEKQLYGLGTQNNLLKHDPVSQGLRRRNAKTPSLNKESDKMSLNKLISQFLANLDVSDYYPNSARRRGQQGITIIQLILPKQSDNPTISVIKSSSFPNLDQAAMALVTDHKEDLEETLRTHDIALNKAIKLRLPIHFKFQ